MKTFEDLKWRPLNGGTQGLAFFENGYGVSVVRHNFSYTDDKTWEIAVLKGNENEYYLCYDTPITDDVLGYQTEENVTNVMRQLQEL